MGSMLNDNVKATKISTIEFINPHDSSLLLCGSGKYILVIVLCCVDLVSIYW